MIKKNILTLFIIVVLVFNFTSCGSSSKGSNNVNLENMAQNEDIAQNENAEQNEDINNNSVKKPCLIELEVNGEIEHDRISNDTLRESMQVFSSIIADDSIFPFEYNGLWGYCDATGNIIINNNYIKALPFSDGYALAGKKIDSPDGIGYYVHYSVINKEGKVITEFPKYGYSVTPESNYRNGKFIFGENKSGSYNLCYIDSEFNFYETTISDAYVSGYKPVFINEAEFAGALIPCMNQNYHKLVDLNGKEIYKISLPVLEKSITSAFGIKYTVYSDCFKYGLNGVFFFKNGYANIMNESGKWGLINLSSGKLEIDYIYDYVGAYSDGVIPVCRYGKWGVIDIKENVLVSYDYKYIGEFTNDRAFAIDLNGNCIIINKKGERIADFAKEKITGNEFYVSGFSNNGVALVRNTHNDIDIISNAGEVLIHLSDRKDLEYYSENYIVANNVLYKVATK